MDTDTITIDELDRTSAVAPISDARLVPVGDGGVVVQGRTVVALNPSGSITWRILDGTATVGELADDIAAVFDADPDAVGEDILTLLRQLGGLGLLEGVTVPAPQAANRPTVEVGTEFTSVPVDLHFTDDDADRIVPGSLASAVTGSTVLVNWSANCGYCIRIADELSSLVAPLRAAGHQLLLVTTGDPDTNRELVAGMDLSLATTTTDAMGDTPFAGLGTPSALVVDGDLGITHPLSVGASDVPALLTELAGIEPVGPDPDDPRFVPVSGGACAPGAGTARVWAGTVTYTAGERLVGVRSDSEAAAAMVDRFLPGLRVDDERAPDNFSLVLPDAELLLDGTTPGRPSKVRELNLLQVDTSNALRARSTRRTLRALAWWISDVAAEVPDDMYACRAMCAVVDGRAVLLPPSGPAAAQLRPRFARIGLSIHDGPSVWLDPAAGTVTVPPFEFPIDEDWLPDDGSSAKSEPDPLEPGTLPLAGWVFRTAAEGSFDRAGVVAAAAPFMRTDDATDLVPSLVELFDRVPSVTVPPAPAKEHAKDIGQVVETLLRA